MGHGTTTVWNKVLGSALTSAAVSLGGCQANPWVSAYVPEDPGLNFAPTKLVELEYVDNFESLAPGGPGAMPGDGGGTARLGHANFTGVFHSGSEGELRSFAQSIGADQVRWGLKFLHSERDTSLQPVTESSTSRIRGRAFNPETGRHDGEKTTFDATTQTTTYVPVADERAYYVFRAVFFRRR